MTRPASYPVSGYTVRDSAGRIVREVSMYDRPADNPLNVLPRGVEMDMDSLARLAALSRVEVR